MENMLVHKFAIFRGSFDPCICIHLHIALYHKVAVIVLATVHYADFAGVSQETGPCSKVYNSCI